MNWTEEAFRFAWRVMLIEKSGSVEYRVRTERGESRLLPRTELTPLQYKMMSTDPDMISTYEAVCEELQPIRVGIGVVVDVSNDLSCCCLHAEIARI